MPHNESEFKAEFREDLQKAYAGDVKVWTVNDMFRSGLPDFNAVWEPRSRHTTYGVFVPIEAKFVKKLPARGSSLLPGVDLTGVQAKFLISMQYLSIPSLVLLGFENIAIACPFQLWPRVESAGAQVPASNVTLNFVMELKEKGFSFEKHRDGWQVKRFFQIVTGINV